jgi:RNA polymerase sigma factor (sigma-70 family)
MKTFTKPIPRLQKVTQSETQLINDLKELKESVIAKMTQKNYESVVFMMDYYNVDRALEPDEIISQAIHVINKCLVNNSYRRLSSLNTFFLSICKNICRNSGRANKKIPITHYINIENLNSGNQKHLDIPDFNPEDDEEYQGYLQQVQAFSCVIRSLGETCQQILDLRLGLTRDPKTGEFSVGDQRPLLEVARTLNITYDAARQRFKRCLDQLKESCHDFILK